MHRSTIQDADSESPSTPAVVIKGSVLSRSLDAKKHRHEKQKLGWQSSSASAHASGS